jgi:ABC-type proline/glycine betaine transport system permease subunit
VLENRARGREQIANNYKIKTRNMKSELKKFLLTCPLALLTLVVPSFFLNNQIISVALLLVLALLMLAIEWNRKNIILYIIVMISGPLAEVIAIYFGVWTYKDSFFAGIPIWLPFVWGNAGLYVVRLNELVSFF